jgi:hypothetical protein
MIAGILVTVLIGVGLLLFATGTFDGNKTKDVNVNVELSKAPDLPAAPAISKLTKSTLALGLLASVAFIPLPAYALDDGADVDVQVERPGILPGLRADPDVDVFVEEDDRGDDDVPPAASVEVHPD